MISCFHEVYLFYFTDHQACYWNADNYSAIAVAFSDVFVWVNNVTQHKINCLLRRMSLNKWWVKMAINQNPFSIRQQATYLQRHPITTTTCSRSEITASIVTKTKQNAQFILRSWSMNIYQKGHLTPYNVLIMTGIIIGYNVSRRCNILKLDNQKNKEQCWVWASG